MQLCDLLGCVGKGLAPFLTMSQPRISNHKFLIMKQLLISSMSIFALLLVFACQNAPKQAAPEQASPTAAAYTLASDKDPVCEMHIDATVEDTAHYNGKIYGFCSPDCKESFKADPAKYAGK